MVQCEMCKKSDGDTYYFHKRTDNREEVNKSTYTYADNSTPITLCLRCIKFTIIRSIFLNLLISSICLAIGFWIFNWLQNNSGRESGGAQLPFFISIFACVLILGGVIFMGEILWLMISIMRPTQNTGDHVAGTFKLMRFRVSALTRTYLTRKQFRMFAQ